MDNHAWKAFASSYILDADLRAKFISLLARRELRYIGNTPLFLTMSAQLFAETGEIYDRKIDLYERYLAHLLGKAVNNDRKKIAALTGLLQIIAEGDCTIRMLVRQHGNFTQKVGEADSALSAEAELRKLLDRTALLRRSGDRLRFSHDLFRSYYRALQLAGSIAPAPRILRQVEPFQEGWAVVEQLLLRWDRNDLNIGPVLRSLLEYGEEGLECAAHVIAGARRPEHGKVAISIAERFLREAKDEEPTLVAQRMLTKLAEANEAVCSLLIDELNSTFLMSDTFIAECLLDAGETDEALEHLLWIAERHDGESWSRITSAELLLKHGYREEALEALRDVARDGDELWSCAEAASILYEEERTAENRELLVDLCAIEPNASRERIFSSTLDRLMAMGEADLALPHLEISKWPSEDKVSRILSLHDAITSAKLIALHRDKPAAKELLLELAASFAKMREKAQIACALADIGFFQEAQAVLRATLDVSALEIDWRTAEQLIRLGLADEARCAVEATILHLLDGRHTVYNAVSLIEHALPIFDKKAMSAFLLSRARSLKEPILSRSLALLGAPEDARRLLSELLDDADPALRVDAAGYLCELGDAQLGQKALRLVVRNKRIAPEPRIAAAQKLKKVGLLRAAAFAFARITRDTGIETTHRTHAAIAFNELMHDKNDLVWHPLMRLLKDKSLPVADRVDAAETLIHIDGEDGYDDLIYPEMLDMLDAPELSDRDILRVCASLGERGWKLGEMPRVLQALQSDTIHVSVKIDALRDIGRYGRNREIDQYLIEIAVFPNISVELRLKAIGAIWRPNENVEAQALLGEIARDSAIPPAWRFKAAKEQRGDLQWETLSHLTHDTSIDIGTRVEAAEALPAERTIDRIKVLQELANSAEITFWDRRQIARAANRLDMAELVTSVLRASRDDRPLSIWEMVELAKLCGELEHRNEAEETLRELLSLPLVILVSFEDTSTVIEGLRLAAKVDRPQAIARLEEMIDSDEIGWSSIVGVLNAYAELAGRDQAQIRATPIVEELGSAIRCCTDEEYSSWIWHAKEFLEGGWFSDFDALLAFAENAAACVTERASACVLIMTYTDSHSSAHRAARNLLTQLCESEFSSLDRARVAQELARAGHDREMGIWLDQCIASPPEEAKDRRTFASILYGLGRTEEARNLVKHMNPSDLVDGFMFRADKALVESVMDDDIADDATLQRIISNDDPFDQIFPARDYVEEHGDPRAMALLLEAASGATGEPHCQLDAIDALNELGFRNLAREMFAAMPKAEIEPYWFGAQLLRFGRKSEAKSFYAEAARTHVEYNESLIETGLADLELIEELEQFRAKLSAC